MDFLARPLAHSRPIEIPKRRKTSANTYVRSHDSPPVSPDMIFDMSPPAYDELSTMAHREPPSSRFMYPFPTLVTPTSRLVPVEQRGRTLTSSPGDSAYYSSAVMRPHMHNHREGLIATAFDEEDDALSVSSKSVRHVKLKSRSRSRAVLYKKMSAFKSVFPTTDSRKGATAVYEPAVVVVPSTVVTVSPEQQQRGRRGRPATTLGTPYLASPPSFRHSSHSTLYTIALPPTVVPSLASTITTSYSSSVPSDIDGGADESANAFEFDKYLIRKIDEEKNKREGSGKKRVNPLLRKKENVPKEALISVKTGATTSRRSRESVPLGNIAP